VSSTRLATADDVDRIVELHATLIAEGFLVQLGRPFLQRLYGRVVRSQRAFAVVVVDGTDVRGFAAATEDTGAFYREFLLRDGLVAGAVALPRVVRAPRSVYETLRYGVRDHGDLPAAELLASAVDYEARGRGFGGQLANAVVDELARRGVASARVVTATDNVAAIRAYERGGFHRKGTDRVHREVDQAVLVWP
jgi:ribosomal protein S18 acetylase RimI-like enzyme